MARRQRTDRPGSHVARRHLVRVVRGIVTTSALLLGALALVAGVVPRLAGGAAYAVLTSSMEPGLPPGTLVVVRPVPPEELGIGDVVTYQLVSGEPQVVTHRIVGMRVGARGAPVFSTRGDANPAADPEPVQAVQIRGRVWYALPWVGRLSLMLDRLDRDLVTRSTALALALAACREFVLARRGSRSGAASSVPVAREGAGSHRG